MEKWWLDLTRMFSLELMFGCRDEKKKRKTRTVCLWGWNSSLTLAWLHHKILIHRACLRPPSQAWVSPLFQSACLPLTLRRLSLVLRIDWEGGWPLTSSQCSCQVKLSCAGCGSQLQEGKIQMDTRWPSAGAPRSPAVPLEITITCRAVTTAH